MLDAYDKARLDGFIGTKADFQKSEYLKGGIDAARAAGFVGGEDEMQSLLIGNQKGVMSPYDFAVAYGFRGTAKDWLDQLNGKDGMGIYELAVSRGFEGDPEEFLKSLAGQDGLDAFQVAKVAGFEGDLSEWLKQLKGDKGDTGPMPAHEWDGARLRFQLPDGSWGEWVNLKGEDGKTWDKPEDGEPGPMPDHQIDGRRIRFEKPDGTWGEWIDLGAGQTVSGGGGGSLSIQKFYDGTDNFPEVGKSQIIYFDTSTDPYTAYIWANGAYMAIGGSGASIQIFATALDFPDEGQSQVLYIARSSDITADDEETTGDTTEATADIGGKYDAYVWEAGSYHPIGGTAESFETVSKNIKAKDFTLTYNAGGDLTTITYDGGAVKTLGYNAEGDLITVTLSGATPANITLTKTLSYNAEGDLIGVAYS